MWTSLGYHDILINACHLFVLLACMAWSSQDSQFIYGSLFWLWVADFVFINQMFAGIGHIQFQACHASNW